MEATAELFGGVVGEAPGRVNLIGEHTDYNGGFVLPMAIPLRTRVSIVRRVGRQARLRSASVAPHGETGTYLLGAEAPGRGWLDYVQGVTWALRADGHEIGGFEGEITSTLPMGGGLASSAALEVSLLRALRDAFQLALDGVRIAVLARRAENEFVGARVGIMDQMAASLAEPGSALFIDTRSLDYRRVRLPPGADVVVLDSGIRHSHASGVYNTRRAECERACELLLVSGLRDVVMADLDKIETLPEPLRGRARHVVTENERVLRAVEAMETGDLGRLGKLLNASHQSMRDDYDVSVPEVDLLVTLAQAEPGVYGARLTGGGFGGCIVVLAASGSGRGLGERLVEAYVGRTGKAGRVLLPDAG